MTETATWCKSSYSGEQDACVEVSLTSERALVRDTKDRDGGTLTVSFAAWSAFVAAIKQAPTSRS